MRKYLTILLLSFVNIIAFSQEYKSDSLKISLLTCSPGEEVYELFGHTAIRVKNLNTNEDLVFNYGLFSFNTPNFIYRFTKGETDYQLGINQLQYFLMDYGTRNSKVTEQVLNLTPEEASNICNALFKNYEPENRVYRYNYFYDNCSTRPRDIIEKNLNGKTIYSKFDSVTTFRTLVHKQTIANKWLTFGIDIAFGVPTDLKINNRAQMFLPEILMNAFDSAKVESRNKQLKSLVKEKIVIVEKQPQANDIQKPSVSPLLITSLLLILILIVGFFEFKRRKTFKVIDSALFLIYGIAGCIVFFLMFVSTHPAIFPNYNGLWLQPFHLFVAFGVWVKKLKNALYYYHIVNFAVLLILLISYPLMLQYFNPAFFPLILILMSRSGIYLLIRMKTKRK